MAKEKKEKIGTARLDRNYKAKEQVFLANVVQKLCNSSFVTAIPQPDTIGEDLWFTPQTRADVIYRAQLKGAWSYSLKGEERHTRQYTQNASLAVLLAVLHRPGALLVYGLAHV